MSIHAHFSAVTAIILATSLSVAPASAGGKPKGATATDPTVIAGLFSGKTSNWDRGGHAYWGPGGVYQAINKNGDWVGLGKWYVTSRSKLCHESVWTGMKNGAMATDDGKWCWEFATAPDGTIWERFLPEKTDWYRHRTSKQVRGHTQKRKIDALRKQYGV